MFVGFRSKNVLLVDVLVILSGISVLYRIVGRVIYIDFEIEYGWTMAIETCQTHSYFIQPILKQNLSKQTHSMTTSLRD